MKRELPALEVRAVYGSTGALFAQITQQAPFDLFLAADTATPAKLVAQGLARGDAFPYAEGRLALWVPDDSPLDLPRLGIRAILDPSVKYLAAANPRHAPYGKAAMAAMEHYGLLEQVRHRVVPGNDIAQTAQFVQAGSCQVGFVAYSHVLGPELRGKGRHWVVPAEAFPPIEQAGVVLARTPVPEAAERVRAFLLGPSFRAVLEGYGYRVSGAESGAGEVPSRAEGSSLRSRIEAARRGREVR
jgi:molybdate transport system substrate-binding protein